MTRKAILAAVACAVAGAIMLFLYMQRFEQEASGGPPVRIIVTTQEIPLGTAIREDMLGVRNLPQSYVEARHIPASEVSRILGVRVRSGVASDEALLWTDLATTSEQQRDLSGLVRQRACVGRRARPMQAPAAPTLAPATAAAPTTTRVPVTRTRAPSRTDPTCLMPLFAYFPRSMI